MSASVLTSVSIIIVNYKVKYLLEQCLLSVRKATENLSVEIFVVDNDSQDDSVKYLKPLFPEVSFIENHENVGFARANNQAIRLSKGEFVLLLNPDTLLGENVLEHVLEFMKIHSDAGGVGVKMIDSHGSFLPESKRSMPTPWVSFCKIFGLSALFPSSRLFGRYALGYLDENEIHSIDVLAGAFMMLRRKALDKAGLLDEQFFMYGEDIDLSFRITSAGYRNYYLPEKILHYKGESTPKHTIRYVKIFYEAMDIFFKKHNPHSSFVYTIFIRFAIALRACMAAVYRMFFACSAPLRNVKKRNPNRVLVCASETCAAHIQQMFSGMQQDDRLYTCSADRMRADELRLLIRNNEISNVVLSDSRLNYGDMLSLMEKLQSEKVDFCIHTQQSKTIVSSNQYYITSEYAG
ncbi:MAG: glycosyltransferase family 2 protein [Bacteroidales bacterium]